MTGSALDMRAQLRCGRYVLPLQKTLVMGVLNVTPDSFSDGGRFHDRAAAVAHASRLVGEGAALLDIGGESTRPGAPPTPVAAELERILPVIDAVRDLGVPISVDTSKPEVMQAALAHGADMINDVNAFRARGALEAVADTAAGICIMHMLGEPRTMQLAPRYHDVVAEVGAFLAARAQAAQAAGIGPDRILVDPGFGFGKTVAHNLELLQQLERLTDMPWPLLVGLSRKSMLGAVTGRAVDERVHASVAAALLAAMRGARIVRVHDVRETCDALSILHAVQAHGRC